MLGLIWPMMGVVVAVGSVDLYRRHGALSVSFVSPAASLANMWDTRMGGALADAISCNAVVKGSAPKTARRSGWATSWANGARAQPAPGARHAEWRHPGRHADRAAHGHHRLRDPPVAAGRGRGRRHRAGADLVLRAAGLSARYRPACAQPPALGERHGGAGRRASGAARHRGSSERAACDDRRRTRGVRRA